jgi:hypothetical protein
VWVKRLSPRTLPTLEIGFVERHVDSGDGVLSFRLQRTRRGVFVDRQERLGTRQVGHAAVFATRESFEQSLRTDDFRFQVAHRAQA